MILYPGAKPPHYWPVQREHPLARGLVFCSWFTEGAGARVTDVSHNGLHGVMNGFAPATTIVVSGGSGGNAAYNQTYTPSGSYDGQPKYVSADSNYWCVFDGMMNWTWALMPANGMPMWDAVAYNNDSSAPTAGSWSAGFSVVAGDVLPGPWFADGGGSLQFGGSDYVLLGTDSRLNPTAGLTLFVIFKPSLLNSTWRDVISRWDTVGGVNQRTYSFGISNTNTLYATLSSNGSTQDVLFVGNQALSTTAWWVGAVTWDGTTARSYLGQLNGTWYGLQNSGSLSAIKASADTRTAIGASVGRSGDPVGVNHSFHGLMSMAGIWSRALSADEVRLVTEQPSILATPYHAPRYWWGADAGVPAWQTADAGAAELEIEALGVSASMGAAGQTAEVGAAELEIEAFGVQGLLYKQFAQVGTAELEIEALGAVCIQWDSTETAGEQWQAVAEMADGTIWVGLQPDETTPRPALRRWRESGRTRLLEQGERTLAEVTGETWAVPLPAIATAVVRVHPAGWALAWQTDQAVITDEPEPTGGVWTWRRGHAPSEYAIQTTRPPSASGKWLLWRYNGSNNWTQRAVIAGRHAQNLEIVAHQGEVWVVEQGHMDAGARRAYRLSGRTLAPLGAAVWPRWLVNWADFGGYCAWYRGRWWGLGSVDGQWGVADHDGQRLRRQSPRGMVDGLHIAETAASRERMEILWNLPAGDDETPSNNWVTWLTWRNQQGQTMPSRELSITSVTAGNGGKIWATGRRWPITGTQQPSRVYIIYTVPLGGLRLEQVELHAGQSASAEPLRVETATLWAIRSEQPLRLAGVELHAGESESEEPLRLESVAIEAGRSASAEPLRVESTAVWASGVVRRLLVEEARLYAHPQNVLPEGWGVRYLVSIDAGIANAVRCVVSKGEGAMEGYVRSDLEHLDPANLDSYQRLPLGPGVELERWGETIRVALAKPEETQVDGVQVVLRRE